MISTGYSIETYKHNLSKMNKREFNREMDSARINKMYKENGVYITNPKWNDCIDEWNRRYPLA